MYFVYFSHVLGSPFMVYSRNSIQHVDVNWGLDSGEVSKGRLANCFTFNSVDLMVPA